VKKLLVLAVAASFSLAFASAGRSITWGQRDGNAHPNVGAMMAFWDPSTPTTLQEL